MKTVSLSDVFRVRYGHQLNLNAMDEDDQGINFVGRTRKRLGIVGRVAEIPTVPPSPAGDITVSLGGSLLSAFVQPAEFYTAQNIKVLTPLESMTFGEKVFYCCCISKNRFKYSCHGREANRSLDSLPVPARSEVPTWAMRAHSPEIGNIRADEFDEIPAHITPADVPAKLVPLSQLFHLYNGISPAAEVRHEQPNLDHSVPLLRPSNTQFASFSEYVDRRFIDARHVYPPGTLYISTNGQGSHTFSYVAPFEFAPNSDVTVAIPKNPMVVREKLFYAMAITRNRRLFSYGRKPKGERLSGLLVPSIPPPYIHDAELLSGILPQ